MTADLTRTDLIEMRKYVGALPDQSAHRRAVETALHLVSVLQQVEVAATDAQRKRRTVWEALDQIAGLAHGALSETRKDR